MNYVRSNALNQSLSLDGQPLDNAEHSAGRQSLVDHFNSKVGPPGAVVAALQKDFVAGSMPYDEMVSYVRFCEYMIHAAQQPKPQ